MKIQSTASVASAGIKLAIYGNAGVGKTTLAGTTGGTPLILSAESGLLSLSGLDLDYAEIKSIQDLGEAFHWLSASEESKKYDWIILDSISEIAEVVLAHELKNHKDGRQAYGALRDQMNSVMKSFRDLPGRNVVLIAKMERIQSDNGLLFAPMFPGAKLGQELPYLMDGIFVLRMEQDGEGKAARWLQCQPEPDARYIVKDRSGKLDAFEQPNLNAILNKIRGKS